jgi:hypothetical protein
MVLAPEKLVLNILISNIFMQQFINQNVICSIFLEMSCCKLCLDIIIKVYVEKTGCIIKQQHIVMKYIDNIIEVST